ncbi:hypothetical protein MmiAt1_15330 [Methanimicrococcus sp. At1]|uniref:Uncharacterized protein n=1 Tax=Methanimicrococcus hacksteinii TaxID=3028293 RepID=A0ABU3VRK3_9EURY|nr:InlB B-repeat-containing protein [Methanimicrococcus sp. At1]MDV0445929.1 hypothetical protein [Methanimicrococcus sp. At1]
MRHTKPINILIALLILFSIFGGTITAADPNSQETAYFPKNIDFTEAENILPEILPETKVIPEGYDETEVSPEPEKLPESLEENEKQNFQLLQARLLLMPEDYGNPTTVEITTKQQLLDEILNALGTKEVDGYGNRIKTTYKLMDNFTVLASELNNTHFYYQYHAQAGTLYSNIDGNNKTITIIVDQSDPARPLLNRVNDVHNTNKTDRLFIKDLTVKYVGDGTYTGDVKVSPFVNDYLVFCDLENITIEVENNIVADYRLYVVNSPTSELCARANGFAEMIQTIPKKDDNGNYVYDSRGQLVYEEIILKDIKISAKTIGYISGKTPENPGQWVGCANGFATTTGLDVFIDNVTLNYEKMDTTSQWSATTSGFAQFTLGQLSNITVNVEGDMIADGYIRGGPDSYAGGYARIYGISEFGGWLKDSSVNVGGNMTAICHENGTPASGVLGAVINGISDTSDTPMRRYNGVEFINNSLTVGGNVTAKAPTTVFITGGIDNQNGNRYGYSRISQDNTVIVYGDVEAIVEQTKTGSYGTTQSLITGMTSGMGESINDTLIVYGNMTSYCQKGNSILIGHTWAGGYGASSLSNGKLEVHGIMSSVSDEGSASVNGMNYGQTQQHENNKMMVFNENDEPHGIYAETGKNTANAQIHGYGITPSTSTVPMTVANNSVYVNGNMTAKAPERVTAAGITYSIAAAQPNSLIENNIIRIDGKILSIADDTTATTAINGYNGFAYSTGFITFPNQKVMNNAVYARDGIYTEVQTGNGYAAGFALQANDSSQIHGNTWLDRPGKWTASSAEETRADYETFIIVPADSKTAGNFYTSVLEGQRVSNELVYNPATFVYEPVTADIQPLLEVSSAADYSVNSPYIISKDQDIGTLGLAGIDASKAVLSGDDLAMPEGSAVMLTAAEGSKRVVKDIPGIGHVYTSGGISGNIFIDGNDDGIKDAGEEAFGVTVKAYYGGTEVSSCQTDANGDYTMPIPLLTVLDPGLLLKMEYSEGYQSSSHANNDYTDQNEILLTHYWTESVSGQVGILSGETGLTVEFDSQGGSAVSKINGIQSGNLIAQPISPTKSGFIFKGWFNESECTNSWDFASDTVTDNITLYAKWDNAYTVIFDSQGGSTINPITGIASGELIPVPAIPYKTDSAFDGWYNESDCINPWDFTTDTITDDITLYAKWINLYTVTFNSMGGNSVNSMNNVQDGSTITLPTPTRSNSPTGNLYVFDGWYKEPSYTNEWIETTDVVTSDTTLYAKWISTYNVSFVVLGGSPQPTNLTHVQYGSSVTEPTAPTKGTDIFGGWFTEPECINQWNFASDTVSGKTVLYAKWTNTVPSTYTVTFDTQGATSKFPNTITGVVSGNKISKPSPNPAKNTGGTFGGWFKEPACINEWVFASDTVTDDTTLYAKWSNYTVIFDSQGGEPNRITKYADPGTLITPLDPAPTRRNDTFDGWFKETAYINEWNFASDMVNGDVYLFAKWITTYTVTFNTAGGTSISPVTGISDGQAISAPADPIRGTDKFEGWYKEPSYTNVWDFAAETVTQDITLYAKWATTYTVTFEANGGTPVPSKLTGLASGSKISVPAEPTKTDYTFEGWYKEPTCLNEWDFINDEVTRNIVLYAKWADTPVTPPVTPPGGGGGGTGGATVNNSTGGISSIQPPEDGGSTGSNDSGSGKIEEPMPGYEEIKVSWLFIFFIYVLAIVLFIYRRKKEKDEEDEYLEQQQMKNRI